jgi:multiple sugar transport system permease protein
MLKYGFVAPALLLLIALNVFPLVFDVYLSTTNYDLSGGDVRSVGGQNYREVFGEPRFPAAIRTTALFVFLAVSVELVLGYFLALALRDRFPGKPAVLTILLVPMMLSPAVMGLFWHLVFKGDYGILNQILGALGLPQPQWLTDPSLKLLSILTVDVWMWTPFMMLISLAALNSIPRYLYEAAEIDRASRFTVFRRITLPLVWLALTSLKDRDDVISPRPQVIPVLRGVAGDASPTFPVTLDAYRELNTPVAGANDSFLHFLANSAIVGLLSTLAAVALGTACAYGFSRFRIPGAKDWLFFILSTRFLPPLAVVVPVLVMFREMNLTNTHLGLVILYTSFNLSLAVWLMKGFIDEIPRAYEEAALVDGYSRMRAFWKIIVPEAAPGMAVTAVFCLISAWNELGFAMTLNNDDSAKTVPPYFQGMVGKIEGLPWPEIAAGALLYVVPIVVFTVLVRKHLLRGVTFGTIKQ